MADGLWREARFVCDPQVLACFERSPGRLESSSRLPNWFLKNVRCQRTSPDQSGGMDAL